jgi:hypothetical protein
VKNDYRSFIRQNQNGFTSFCDNVRTYAKLDFFFFFFFALTLMKTNYRSWLIIQKEI